MKKILISLFITTNILFAGMNNSGINYEELDKMSANDIVRNISNEVAKNLPIQIDYLTVMVNIFGFGNTIVTKKEVYIEHKDIQNIWKNNKDNFIKSMYKIDSQNICYTPIWKYMTIKRNIIAEFQYVDNNSRPLFQYTVEKSDCEKLLK